MLSMWRVLCLIFCIAVTRDIAPNMLLLAYELEELSRDSVDPVVSELLEHAQKAQDVLYGVTWTNVINKQQLADLASQYKELDELYYERAKFVDEPKERSDVDEKIKKIMDIIVALREMYGINDGLFEGVKHALSAIARVSTVALGNLTEIGREPLQPAVFLEISKKYPQLIEPDPSSRNQYRFQAGTEGIISLLKSYESAYLAMQRIDEKFSLRQLWNIGPEDVVRENSRIISRQGGRSKQEQKNFWRFLEEIRLWLKCGDDLMALEALYKQLDQLEKTFKRSILQKNKSLQDKIEKSIKALQQEIESKRSALSVFGQFSSLPLVDYFINNVNSFQRDYLLYRGKDSRKIKSGKLMAVTRRLFEEVQQKYPGFLVSDDNHYYYYSLSTK